MVVVTYLKKNISGGASRSTDMDDVYIYSVDMDKTLNLLSDLFLRLLWAFSHPIVHKLLTKSDNNISCAIFVNVRPHNVFVIFFARLLPTSSLSTCL